MPYYTIKQGQRLADLCRENSNLTESDIHILQGLLNNLQDFADLTGSDIFIDVPTKDPEAFMVVAEAKPTNAPSLYKENVVGKYALRFNEPAIFKTYEKGETMVNMQGVSQEGVPISQRVKSIKNNQGEVIAVLIMERDNSFQVRQEKTVEVLSNTTQKLTDTLLNLSNVEELFPTLIHDALLIIDYDGRISYANKIANGWLKSLVAGINPIGMAIDELTQEIDALKLIFSSDSDVNEVNINGRNLLARSLHILDKTDVRGTVYLLRDITELRKKEKQLIAKSAVIKEIHHRVKNNLQTISSLMRLQMRRVNNEEARVAFQESINRIGCIALVHERFSRESPDVIELRECIQDIVNILTDMLPPDQNITIDVNGDVIYLASEQATPVAIVVNEIIQNSFKYAFNNAINGKLTIDIEQNKGRVKIVIHDSGAGFPEGFDIAVNANLGLQITQALVGESLGGNITMYNDAGAVVEIDFPWGVENSEVSANRIGR
ncbi:sensor histidine kinase [Desulfotomaculum sp. 1211_IL3151]|uniref:sensor histidine kinase n=1 Tax=Desulfotomaculum sp. 1211_IL3151 TaxID=3084055 RepID=UPI002FDB6D50